MIHDNLRFRGASSSVGNEKNKEIHSGRNTNSGFCVKCNAWHGQLGLESTFQLYLDHMMTVCAEIKRVLKKTGSFWLNMGDTYGGSCGGHGDTGLFTNSKRRKTAECMYNTLKPQRGTMAKCLIGIPWRLVLRLVDEQGWILRNSIIWSKPNAMPSSVKDRCSNSYEFLFHLVKAKRYWYDLDAIREKQKYPEDVARRIRQDKKDGIMPFAKDNKDGIAWRRDQRSFNYRVREAKKGHTGIIGVKSTEEEMATYNRKGQRIPGQTTQGMHRKQHSGYYGETGECLVNPKGKNPGDVWTIPTQPRPEAHFATFPDKLCIKPILATCPAEVCKKCGKARVRIIKKDYIDAKSNPNKDNYGQPHLGYKVKTEKGFSGTKSNRAKIINKTIGWTNCGCNAGFDSGIVLDPFAGRGTSLIMAKKLGRHYIGYELKKEYADMAERELEEIDPLFRNRKTRNTH